MRNNERTVTKQVGTHLCKKSTKKKQGGNSQTAFAKIFVEINEKKMLPNQLRAISTSRTTLPTKWQFAVFPYTSRKNPKLKNSALFNNPHGINARFFSK